MSGVSPCYQGLYHYYTVQSTGKAYSLITKICRHFRNILLSSQLSHSHFIETFCILTIDKAQRESSKCPVQRGVLITVLLDTEDIDNVRLFRLTLPDACLTAGPGGQPLQYVQYTQGGREAGRQV